MCPALWARPRSQKSRCPAILIKSHVLTIQIHKPVTITHTISLTVKILMGIVSLLVHLSPTYTASLDHLEKPAAYRRTTPSPLLCGAHNKGEHIVRGEVGSIVQSSLQGMAMGLRSACCISRLFAGVRTAFGFRNIAISALVERMSMAWHLCHAQRRLPHSAGQSAG